MEWKGSNVEREQEREGERREGERESEREGRCYGKGAVVCVGFLSLAFALFRFEDSALLFPFFDARSYLHIFAGFSVFPFSFVAWFGVVCRVVCMRRWIGEETQG